MNRVRDAHGTEMMKSKSGEGNKRKEKLSVATQKKERFKGS